MDGEERKDEKKSNIINEVSFFKVFACMYIYIICVYFTRDRERRTEYERFVAGTHHHKSAQYFCLSCRLGFIAAKTKAIEAPYTRIPIIHSIHCGYNIYFLIKRPAPADKNATTTYYILVYTYIYGRIVLYASPRSIVSLLMASVSGLTTRLHINARLDDT